MCESAAIVYRIAEDSQHIAKRCLKFFNPLPLRIFVIGSTGVDCRELVL